MNTWFTVLNCDPLGELPAGAGPLKRLSPPLTLFYIVEDRAIALGGFPIVVLAV